MANRKKEIPEYLDYYAVARDNFSAWPADITDNEDHLASKAFRGDSLDDAQKWGNHLLEILRAKKGK